MPRGYRVTAEESLAIYRLASLCDDQYEWKYTLAEVAKIVKLDKRTVRNEVRHATRNWYEHIRWKTSPPESP